MYEEKREKTNAGASRINSGDDRHNVQEGVFVRLTLRDTGYGLIPDLAQKMKDIRPDIPLILITGFGHVINRERAREIGFQEYLLKPAPDLSRTIPRSSAANREIRDFGLMNCGRS